MGNKFVVLEILDEEEETNNKLALVETLPSQITPAIGNQRTTDQQGETITKA